MENNQVQKPCAVQKIETSQGFSVVYKERFLYSKYSPSKLIISTIKQLQLQSGTIVLCNSPLLGYGLQELLQKLPDDCLLVLCEADATLYAFTLKELSSFFSQSDNKLLFPSPDELSGLPVTLYNLNTTGKYRRVISLDFSAATQFNKSFYDKLYEGCTSSIMTWWKNRLTLTKFGRRYSRNFFENLHYLADSKPITSFFCSIEKPIIVFGAGQSTQTFLDHNKINADDFFILCADTALQPLVKNGVIPDGVFIEEAQSIISKAFIGMPQNIHIFAGLSSIPNITHNANAQNLSFFFTEYAQTAFLTKLKNKSFMPPSNLPFGSVGLTAVYYALKFRKNDSIPIYVTGLDFSYSAGITHTKGALSHILHLITGNRLLGLANYNAAFAYGTEKFIDKSGNQFITTPSLKSYAQTFNSIFSAEKNIFDAGESGMPLQIPHRLPDNQNHNRYKQTVNQAHPIEELKAFIFEYLSEEHKALLELKALLTGKTKLKGTKLLEEITKIAEPREYLYLHFADGWKFSTEQSFLNRIRTEIDFFLKII